MFDIELFVNYDFFKIDKYFSLFYGSPDHPVIQQGKKSWDDKIGGVVRG